MTDHNINVLRKSNVYVRRAEVSVWGDGVFLSKIRDAQLLGMYLDEFRKNNPSRDRRVFFTADQIDLMDAPVSCHFAPGVKTYGVTLTPDGQKKLVCRCPYAGDPVHGPEHCGAAWNDCHAAYVAVEYDENDFKPVLVPSQVNVPVEPPIPPVPTTPEPTKPEIPQPTKDESPKTEVPRVDPVPPSSQTPLGEVKPATANNVVKKFDDVKYPENLSVVYGGFEINGLRVTDGYEVRITSGGAFVANVTCNGFVLGNHPKLGVKMNAGRADVTFGESEIMTIFMDHTKNPCIVVSVGTVLLKIPVK